MCRFLVRLLQYRHRTMHYNSASKHKTIKSIVRNWSSRTNRASEHRQGEKEIHCLGSRNHLKWSTVVQGWSRNDATRSDCPNLQKVWTSLHDFWHMSTIFYSNTRNTFLELLSMRVNLNGDNTKQQNTLWKQLTGIHTCSDSQKIFSASIWQYFLKDWKF